MTTNSVKTGGLSPVFEEIQRQRDLLITNIVLSCQVPSIAVPARDNDSDSLDLPLRAKAFSERLQEMGVDECSADAEGNPIGVVKGTDSSCPPIVLAAHLDTVFEVAEDSYCTVSSSSITGPGLLDNSLSVGVLLSIPPLLRAAGIRLKSDLLLVALKESLGKANLRSARQFVSEWDGPIRAAVCLEGGELGRLNYYSDAMTRIEIRCDASMDNLSEGERGGGKRGVNALLVANEIINRILSLRLPQRPETRIVIGTLIGGVKFGIPAVTARLGLEIHSTSDDEVRSLREAIRDIATSVAYEQRVAVDIAQISSVNAANPGYSHPLVKAAQSVLADLGVEPLIGSSESELAVFLEAGIPAVTIGLSRGSNYHLESATMDIDSLFTGVAQVLELLKRIDGGACDE